VLIVIDRGRREIEAGVEGAVLILQMINAELTGIQLRSQI
jgi:hypothetical protein